MLNRLTAAIRNPALWPWMIATAAAVLRAWHLLTPMLWYDEAFTYLITQRPIEQLIMATAADVHPPAHYMLIQNLRLFLPWLAPVVVMRGASLVLSLLSLLWFWRITGRLQLPHTTRLLALGLMAILPIEIYYAQEGRMYALYQWLVLDILLNIYDRRWFALGMSATLLLYTHNYAVFYLPVLAVIALGRELWTTTAHPTTDPENIHANATTIKSNFRAIFLAFGLPVLAWLPWLLILLSQMVSVSAGYWIQPITPSRVLVNLLHGWYALSLPMPLEMLATLSLVTTLLIITLYAFKNHQLMLFWLAFGPLLLAIAASLLWRPVLLSRGLLPSLPALAILAAMAWSSARDAARLARWLVLAPLLIILLWQLQSAQPGHDHKLVAWPAITAKTVYHLDDTTLLIYSANQPLATHYLIDTGCPEQIAALTPTTRHALGLKTIKLADLPPDYTIAAMVGPLASYCQERVYHQLTDQAVPLSVNSSAIGTYGVWIYASVR